MRYQAKNTCRNYWNYTHRLTGKSLVEKYLPKHADMDKILQIIQRKALKGTYLSITVKEVHAGY